MISIVFYREDFFRRGRRWLLNNQTTNIFYQWRLEKPEQLRRHKLVKISGLSHRKYFSDSASRVAFFESVLSKKLWHLIGGVFGDEIGFRNTQLFFNPVNSAQLAFTGIAILSTAVCRLLSSNAYSNRC